MLITSISHWQTELKLGTKHCVQISKIGVYLRVRTYPIMGATCTYILCICISWQGTYGARNGLCSIRIDRFLANGTGTGTYQADRYTPTRYARVIYVRLKLFILQWGVRVSVGVRCNGVPVGDAGYGYTQYTMCRVPMSIGCRVSVSSIRIMTAWCALCRGACARLAGQGRGAKCGSVAWTAGTTAAAAIWPVSAVQVGRQAGLPT
jgi:hypothetical protein